MFPQLRRAGILASCLGGLSPSRSPPHFTGAGGWFLMLVVGIFLYSHLLGTVLTASLSV